MKIQKIMYGFLFLGFFTAASGQQHPSSCEPAFIINRLDRCVMVLKRFNDNHKMLCQSCFKTIERRIAECQETECYKDPAIRAMLTLMHKEQCIEPLFDAWKSCKDCITIDASTDFLQEFSQIIFVVYKELLPVAQQEGIVGGNHA